MFIKHEQGTEIWGNVTVWSVALITSTGIILTENYDLKLLKMTGKFHPCVIGVVAL